MISKKLLVLSDTHGHIQALKAVLNWAKKRLPPDDTICCAAFLGDGISDLSMPVNEAGFYCDWKFVRGNNDYEFSIPEAVNFNFGDHCFHICHGHRHSLYGSYRTLIAAARSNNADIVLFGHTHIPSIKNVDGVTLINPGSAGRPRSRIGASFAVIECTQGQPPEAEFWGIDEKWNIKKLN